MNERYTLDSEAIRAWLDAESRKSVYLTKHLNVSQRSVDKILAGHVPKMRTIEKIAQLMGVEVQALLTPKAKAG